MNDTSVTGRVLRRLVYGLISVLLMTVLGSVSSTQFVLHELSQIGAAATFTERLSMTAADIVGMGPLYGVIMAAAFLLAFPVAGWLSHRISSVSRVLLFAVAGGAAVMATLLLMEKAFFNLAVIAGARTLMGVAVQGLCGAIAGALYGSLSRTRS